MFKFIAFCTALSCFCSHMLSKDIDNVVNEALKAFNVPGAAIAVVLGDQVVVSKGYGVRCIEENLPVTEHTLFPIASCTKAFTALILSQLAQEGKVSLDDLVKKYIPEFCLSDLDLSSKLTIRDLLAHRTGLARHDPIWLFLDISRPDVIKLLEGLEADCGLRQEFRYNNFMYTIAGMIIERVTGRSWEETVTSRLLIPLKMTESNTSIKELKNTSNYARPYIEINRKITAIPFRDPFAINPAGGINSTILDMTKWLKAQLSSSNIISQETLKELYTIQISFPLPTNADEEMYQVGHGLGWYISKYRGHNLIGHGGDMDGFSSEICFLPKQSFGIVILTNNSSNGRLMISSVRNQLIDKFLGIETTNWIKKLHQSHNKEKQNLEDSLKAFEKDASYTDALEDYVGCYEHPAYGVIELKRENQDLVALYGKASIPLHYKFDDIFMGKISELLTFGINPIIDITFSRDASGYIYKVEIPFEKFRSAKPITFIRKLSYQE